MVTASGNQEKVASIEAGADDFIRSRSTRPSCSRGSTRCCASSATTTRSSRRRPSSPPGTVSSSSGSASRSKRWSAWGGCGGSCLRRSPSWCSRRATSRSCRATGARSRPSSGPAWVHRFAETVEPEDVMVVLGSTTSDRRLVSLRATLDHFAGDGILAIFNDPLPCPDPPGQAIRMALAMRDRWASCSAWRNAGHDLDVGIGIALGHATLGTVGSAGRSTTRRSAPSSTWPRVCRTRPRRADPHQPARLFGDPRHRRRTRSAS